MSLRCDRKGLKTKMLLENGHEENRDGDRRIKLRRVLEDKRLVIGGQMERTGLGSC